MVFGMPVVAMRKMSMMRAGFVVAFRDMGSGLAMMFSGMLVVLGGVFVVLGSMFGVRHDRLLFCRILRSAFNNAILRQIHDGDGAKASP